MSANGGQANCAKIPVYICFFRLVDLLHFDRKSTEQIYVQQKKLTTENVVCFYSLAP